MSRQKLTVVLSQAQGKHPVAAHAFLDHLMNTDVAMHNFAWNGYQPAVQASVPANFRHGAKYEGITGPELASSIVPPSPPPASMPT